MPIQRIEASLAKLGNDEIYGNGSDGTVIIASDVSLSRDMYYQNLTVNSGFTLTTNGFRVFVKNTLTINGTIGIKTGTAVTTGTVSGTTALATSTTNSLGGSAAGATYTASSMSPAVYQWIESLLNGGVKVMPVGVVTVAGGAGGGNGVAGTRTLAVAGSGATAGGAGTAGLLSLRTVGQPGAPGSSGTSGTNGAKGTDVPAASAGAGNIGGGIVFISAKTITGSGSIVSQGSNATAGGAAAVGTGATNGAAGTAGTSSPNVAVAHHADNHLHYDYPGGHAAAPAPALPHGHNPHHYSTTNEAHIHRWVHGNHIHHSNQRGHLDHGYMCPGGHGGNFAHTYQYHDARPNNGGPDFYHINGIPHSPAITYNHSAPHFYNDTGVVYPHCVFPSTNIKGEPIEDHGSWPRQHYDNYVWYVLVNPTTVKHVGHTTANGGAGGSAGAAGTNGTNGSTTAGTNGQSGGGGGIICISDEAIPVSVTTSQSGGTLSGVSGTSGTIITIINK